MFRKTLPYSTTTTVSFPVKSGDSLYRRISPLGSPTVSIVPVLDQSIEEGRSLKKEQLQNIIQELRRNSRFKHALEVENFVHTDMHPGNILVRTSRSRVPSKQLFKFRPHVVFLDVGMTTELYRKDRVTLLEFFKAVVLRNGRTAADCTLRLSKQ